MSESYYWEPPLRDPLTVENEEEIVLAFENDRPTLTCGYCGDRCRRRNVEAALIWFHHHPCVSTYS